MATYQVLECKKCKHYESFHQYPNPNAVARHYCKSVMKKLNMYEKICSLIHIWFGCPRNVISMVILKSQKRVKENEKTDI